MLSLPLIPPQPDLPLGRRNFHPRPESPPPNGRPNQHGPAHQNRPQPQNRNQDALHLRSHPLALLTADESAIAARKAAIRNFGAYWIRPPGIPKTLQATTEEAAELAEQEEQLRQEQGLRDLQAQQQLDEARARAAEMGEDAGVGERDLDEELPDADAQQEEDEEEESEEEGGGGDVTFNEESMVEGSRLEAHDEEDEENVIRYAELEEAELTGVAQDEADLGIERNLDDSIPEAGSYQHTDTELEDDTEEEDSSLLRDSFAGQTSAPRQQPQGSSSGMRRPNMRSSTRSQTRAQRQALGRGRLAFDIPPDADNGMGQPGNLQERLRGTLGGQDAMLTRSPGSLNLSSSILESSFVGSSPAMQRGARGRGGRGGGRTS